MQEVTCMVIQAILQEIDILVQIVQYVFNA